MTTLKDLHALVDQLPECEWPAARQILLGHLKKHNPVAYALFTAPEDDPTVAEVAAIEESYAAIAQGEPVLSDAELKKELGL